MKGVLFLARRLWEQDLFPKSALYFVLTASKHLLLRVVVLVSLSLKWPNGPAGRHLRAYRPWQISGKPSPRGKVNQCNAVPLNEKERDRDSMKLLFRSGIRAGGAKF